MHYYRTAIISLLRRGNDLRLLCDKKWSEQSSLAVFDELKKEFPNFSYGWAVPRADTWRNILFHTRELLSYRRYLVVRKNRQSTYYKERYLKYISPTMRFLLNVPGIKYAVGTRLCGSVLQGLERLAPAFSAICDDIRAYAPDVVIAAPVNLRFASADLEYLKSAKKMKIPTALPVLSWDNLTTKSLIHVFPDRLLVWNDVQQEEAQDHQKFPADKIRIVGASVFDSWFSRLTPSQTREQFCAAHGLRPEDPIIAYLGSSGKMARDETWLVEALLSALQKADDPRLHRAQIIVRPHPSNYINYERFKDVSGIAVIPKKGTLPDSHASLQLFYDTLAHSIAAIDGANTSAIIDAIIAGSSGIAIVTDKYAPTQRETKHFNQLVDAGALYIAQGAEAIPAIITKLMDGHDERKENRAAFVRRYIRPRGLERQAGEWVADEVEKIMRPAAIV